MLALDRMLQFTLAPELEAHEPAEVRGSGRDDVRLLVSERDGDRITHTHFHDLPRFLRPGDLLVANTSGTVPAEVTARRTDGTRFALRFSTHLAEERWSAEPREVRIAPGERVSLPEGAGVRFIAPYHGSPRLWEVEVQGTGALIPYLLRHGRPIRYSYVPRQWPLDAYQTVFTRELGSAEMPSAARPFTQQMVERLERAEVRVAPISLHCGVSSLESGEPPYPERYRVSAETAGAVNAARAAGGRVIAIGTTAVRALESAADQDGVVRPSEGWTDLVVTPERGVRVVDGLLTGFHEPQATHLAMLEAIAGCRRLNAAYNAALDGRYLWHEFGDVHLIL
jgi:S-adenosylmethionine:tRNA ribosyltransferase-isomerase